MNHELQAAIKHVEELRGIMLRLSLNATKDQAILIGQANDTLDELEEYNIPHLIGVF